MTADEARELLTRRHGIESAFVRVAQLSKILGLAAPTIYSAMREGRFFLPHRMLCSIPAVRVDDLAEPSGIAASSSRRRRFVGRPRSRPRR